MDNFYKYLPVSSDDLKWGLQVLHAGYHEYKPGDFYPDATHPSHHNFEWKKGRILNEYALIYITGGSGIYHSETTGDIPLEGGSAIVVFPKERHRYRPNLDTGWEEYWIGFDGPFMNNLVDEGFFDPLQPVFSIGYNETMINLFKQTFEVIKDEKTGYQPFVSGAAIYMLGQLYSGSKQTSVFQGIDEQIVNHARMIIRANLETRLSPKGVADSLQISYSRFRKLFKEYTGMAPVQYQIQLKLERAKEELVNTSKPIKEIAYGLNFDSTQYFSNLFKKKTTLTPLEFRNRFGK